MTEDEFTHWRTGQLTKEIFQHIKQKREDIKELLANNNIPPENRDLTIGLCQAYADILAIEFNNLSNEEEDDTRDRTP
jgi:DNA-binding transcriptional regulator GbsR (MarR family)